MKKKFATRHIDAEKTNDKKIMYKYRKQIQIIIMKRQTLSRTAIDA